MSTQPPPPTSLIDPTYLFRFEVDLEQQPCQWGAQGLTLPPSCSVPAFSVLGGGRRYADVRLGWSGDAIGFSVEVRGKRSQLWCRDTRLEDSDGFHFWIDTRCSPGIHRATQYCHHFLFMPAGGGVELKSPVGHLMPINRARQNPNTPAKGSIQVHSSIQGDGYRLSGRIGSGAMTGFDPAQFGRIGFFYAVVDRELGWQTLALSRDYPFIEDPSLWVDGVLLAKNG